MPTCVDAIAASLARLSRFEPDKTGWVQRHRQEWAAASALTAADHFFPRHKTAARAVVRAIEAAALDADAEADRG